MATGMDANKVYVGSFGSFHSSDTLKQLLLPDDQYKAPPLPPVTFPKFTEKVDFGAAMKEKHFMLDKDWTFINHGAFGAALKEALQAETAWQTYVESQPVRFIDRELFPQLIHTITRVAKFLDASKTDVVFVQNATTGNDAVIQSVVKTLTPKDSILITSFAYGTVKKILRQIEKEKGIRVDEVKIEFPITSTESLVKLIEDAIKPDTKFAVLDHIPSVQAVVLPIKEMIAACHKRGVQVLVDGAHCFGSMPISMREIGVDYYVLNAHKWLCSTKGCAVLYVDRKYHSIVRPLLVSWAHGYGFNSEFGWTGLMNYTTYLSMHTVLDFWEFYGPETIRDYLYKTARDASEMLVKSWGTKLLADSSFFAAMVAVALPEGLVPAESLLPREEGKEQEYNYSNAVIIQNTLHHKYNIEVPIKVISGKLFVRISAHVYNCASDYKRLSDAINDIKLNNK